MHPFFVAIKPAARCAALAAGLALAAQAATAAPVSATSVTFSGVSSHFGVMATVGPITRDIGPGAEFDLDISADPGRVYRVLIDLSESSLILELTRNVGLATPQYYDFFFSDIAYAPTGILSNTTGSSVSFRDNGPNAFAIRIDNMSIGGNVTERLALSLAAVQQVPEPASLALAACALALVGLSSRQPPSKAAKAA